MRYPGGSAAYAALVRSQTTTSLTALFNPAFNTNWSAQYTQPLLRNFKIDNARQQLIVTRLNQDISEIQLQASIINIVSNVRNAYWDFVFATQAVDVARRSVELAERLAAIAPPPITRAYFCNSGSEAIDTAIKLIWYYNNARGLPAKKKIIARVKAYHGVTVAAASLTGLPALHNEFDLPIAGILRTDCPHYYRFGEKGESEEAFATRCADNLERLILAEGPDTVAALFAEPVQGAGGVIIPAKTYWEKINAVLKKYDVLLVADEVICGFGRTGNWWGTQTFGLKPDIITSAKQLSAGQLPIAAILINQRVYEVLRDNSNKLGGFAHGLTYSGHPVSSAVALETIKIYEDERIVDIRQQVHNRARQLIEEHSDKMHAMAKALLDWETIDSEQLDDIMAGKEPRPPKDWTPRTPSSGGDGSGGGTPAVAADTAPTVA